MLFSNKNMEINRKDKSFKRLQEIIGKSLYYVIKGIGIKAGFFRLKYISFLTKCIQRILHNFDDLGILAESLEKII